MKIKILAAGLCLLVFSCNYSRKPEPEQAALWPEIEPYQTDYLCVSDMHEIYYELNGNPNGQAVFALHGGPGGESSPYMRRFFNPEKFLIVLHDQRGAGKSKPFAEIQENTTQHLVEDIERLRKHLGVDKMILFGGSWGSTLALAYAQAYPEQVSGLVLRGIFTAKKEEIDHFYHGGIRPFFPEVYDKFITAFPEPDRRPLPPYLLNLIQSDDSTTQAKYSRLWAEYELKISGLDLPDTTVQHYLDEFNPLAFSTIENYYMANGCFLEEGQLLRDAHKIAHIPAFLVNGRYDMICPPINAYRLHKKLPNSELIIAEAAGHWMGEIPVEKALLLSMRHFE